MDHVDEFWNGEDYIDYYAHKKWCYCFETTSRHNDERNVACIANGRLCGEGCSGLKK